MEEGTRGLWVGRSMCQRLVVGERCPTMMVEPLRSIVTDVLSKWAVHPESHSWPIDMRECWRSGMM
jgi:hypothetical protein